MEARKIKEIVFCFENLEQITVPIDEVAYFSFLDTCYSISLVRNQERITLCAKEALIVLKPNANKKAVSSFADAYFDSVFCKPDLFARLILERDCVGIDLVYKNDDETSDLKRKEIYLPWKDYNGNEFVNALQKAFIQDNEYVNWQGCLCVHFGETWDTIDNPESVDISSENF